MIYRIKQYFPFQHNLCVCVSVGVYVCVCRMRVWCVCLSCVICVLYTYVINHNIYACIYCENILSLLPNKSSALNYF